MIDILPSPDHVIAVRLAGTLTEAEYDRVMAETEAKLQRHRHVGVYVDMADFDDLSAEAATKNVAYSQSKLAEAHRFPRKAVVTDKQWIKVLIQGVAPLVPGIEARSFAPSERDKALAWVAEVADW